METYIFYLTVFIGILTFALAGQALILFVLYRRVKHSMDELEKTVARLTEQSTTLMARADELITDIKRHVDRYGQVGDEISARLQRTVNSIVTTVEHIGNLASNGTATVVRETRAIMQAVVQTITHLGRRDEPRKLPPPAGHSSSLH
jgi:uncharacterized protein YoxC